MAGAGSRFQEAGYKEHKPVIPTTDRRSGLKVPMVVAATKDMGASKSDQVIYIDRNFHKDDGVENEIKRYYPDAKFITIDYLTEGQASTCLLARDYIDSNEELLIGACDNGMDFDATELEKLKQNSEALIFTYRNNDLVLEKPTAHGWVYVDEDDRVTGMSVKKPISDNPLNDHAVVATFWFRHGKDFIRSTEKMITENDRVNNEFYVDQVMQHAVELGICVRVFEIKRYICWGTPRDYECYEKTIEYWRNFYQLQGIAKL